ncbi:MAG: glycine cleavage system protein T, partial [Chromatiales bacterium]|nr:glycine cleavage system protein T [Chromatiales bacterium]
GSRGTDLWNRVKAAGAPFGIGPGCPNPIERIESGLLSYGGDTDGDTNPFEVRMEKYIHLDVSDDVIGIKALRDIHAAGPARRQVGLRLDMDGELPYLDRPSTILLDNNVIGAVTAHCYSPRLEKNIGMGLVPHRIESGTQVEVRLADGRHCGGMICELPFI